MGMRGLKVRFTSLPKEGFMATREVCGNGYDKSFEIVRLGRSMVFDNLERGIHALAPTCAHCECHIIGHGLEADGRFFCCANCAKHYGRRSLR